MKAIHYFCAAALCAEVGIAPVQAQAQRPCGPRHVVVKQLTDSYGETLQSIGLRRDNALIEIFASPSSGSWTIVATTPAGLSCLVAAGQSFETLAARAPSTETDT